MPVELYHWNKKNLLCGVAFVDVHSRVLIAFRASGMPLSYFKIGILGLPIPTVLSSILFRYVIHRACSLEGCKGRFGLPPLFIHAKNS